MQVLLMHYGCWQFIIQTKPEQPDEEATYKEKLDLQLLDETRFVEKAENAYLSSFFSKKSKTLPGATAAAHGDPNGKNNYQKKGEFDKGLWVIDTAATSHFCNDKSLFLDLKPITNMKMSLATEDKSCPVEGIGTLRFRPPEGQNDKKESAGRKLYFHRTDWLYDGRVHERRESRYDMYGATDCKGRALNAERHPVRWTHHTMFARLHQQLCETGSFQKAAHNREYRIEIVLDMAFSQWYLQQRIANPFLQPPCCSQMRRSERGYFQHHNSHSWAVQRTCNTYSNRFLVKWAGILGDHLIIILPDRLTGPRYLIFLEQVLPELFTRYRCDSYFHVVPARWSPRKFQYFWNHLMQHGERYWPWEVQCIGDRQIFLSGL
ncbi:gag_pre-integrs domain-containing protein [Trichonephila clavipes]|nr:gag_pre-integrs domain-containing protein [Trichonephila clavipes]